MPMYFLLNAANNPLSLEKWEALFKDWRLFAEGLLTTLEISVGALALAVVLGLLFGVMGTAKNSVFRGISRVYVEFFQNTPLLIQIFFVYNGLPLLGIVMSVPLIGILCVGIYHGAYISEVIRSGIQSIPRGQEEAALSQGLTATQTMREIILPQAWRIVLPPFTNQVVSLIKNTSMVAIITGVDIMYVANSWSGYNLYYAPAFIAAGALYFILCFPLTTLASRMEIKNKEAY